MQKQSKHFRNIFPPLKWLGGLRLAQIDGDLLYLSHVFSITRALLFLQATCAVDLE